MSSTFKCLLTKIDKIEKVEGTDRLFRAYVKGWIFLCSGIPTPSASDHTGDEIVYLPPYSVNDKVVYIQPDSLLDAKLIGLAFPEGMESKIKPDSLESHRIRCIKIRGNISEGLLLDPKKLEEHYPKLKGLTLEEDVKDILNVKKYEAPIKSMPKGMRTSQARIKNPFFKEYIDLNNIKYYPDLFLEGEPVYITEKGHGTSARYGLLPAFPGRILAVTETKPVYLFQWMYRPHIKLFNLPVKVEFFKKNLFLHIKKLLRIPLGHEFCIGSRRTEISLRGYKNGFYSTDVYTKIALQENIQSKLKPGEELFGEIIGSGIQGSYTYGCKEGEHRLLAYDVFNHNENRWLTPVEFISWCYERGVEHVPVLNREGKAIDKTLLKLFGCVSNEFSHGLIDKLKAGESTIGPQKIREGVVVKSMDEKHDPRIGRKVLKVISDDYLTQKNGVTEWH
jgi:RNA ligase (TIGR02306 family)